MFHHKLLGERKNVLPVCSVQSHRSTFVPFFAAICYLLSGLAFVHAQQPSATESRMEQPSLPHQSRAFYNVKATVSAPLAFLPDDIFVFVPLIKHL